MNYWIEFTHENIKILRNKIEFNTKLKKHLLSELSSVVQGCYARFVILWITKKFCKISFNLLIVHFYCIFQLYTIIYLWVCLCTSTSMYILLINISNIITYPAYLFSIIVETPTISIIPMYPSNYFNPVLVTTHRFPNVTRKSVACCLPLINDVCLFVWTVPTPPGILQRKQRRLLEIPWPRSVTI